ncbi:MAG TPA: energy-coupling factor ABC transporter permease [Bacteroidota bacterium]|nr:energy-coupling factor ABC transporter permease [Bacteroidota bacterium]
MHIPDGFLDTKTIIATSLFSAAGISNSLRELRRNISPRNVPLMGLSAAFIFVAQMLNFPVIGGTSGHLIGAVLVSVLLGPSAGIVIMSVVLIVQCLLFADGGVFALGANIFNMGIVAVFGGYWTYRALLWLIPSRYGKFIAAGLAAWSSTVLAAVCCTGELAWSGTVQWSYGLPAMAGIHILIGIGEALITTLVLAAIYKARPDLLPENGRSSFDVRAQSLSGTLLYGVVTILGLALFVTPFASKWPDGLERIASQFGFEAKAFAKPVVPSPAHGYSIPGVGSLGIALPIAAVVGATCVFVLSFILARMVSPRSSQEKPQSR